MAVRVCVSLLLASIILTLGGSNHVLAASVSVGWSAYRRDDGNTGASKARAAKGRVAWKVSIPRGIPSEVLVQGDTPFCLVYTIVGGKHAAMLCAIDRRSGSMKWQKLIDRVATVWSVLTPAVDDKNRVYVASYGGRLLCLSASDGHALWSFECDRPTLSPGQFGVTSPKVSDTSVFVGFGDYFYAVDKNTGKRQWRISSSFLPISSPALDGKRLYLAGAKLVALDANSGKTVWSTLVDVGTPAFAGGRVFVTSCNGRLYCMNSSNGRIVWSSKKLGTAVVGMAVSSTGVVIVHAYDDSSTKANGKGRLVAVDSKTGKIKWQYWPLAGSDQPCVGAGGIVYSTNGYHLVAISGQTHRLKWSLDLRRYRTWSVIGYSSPTTGPDGIVYVANGDRGLLYAVR